MNDKKKRVWPVALASREGKVIYVESYARKLAVEAADRLLSGHIARDDMTNDRIAVINMDLDHIRRGITRPGKEA